MAEIVNFPEANTTFVAEGCNDLPTFRLPAGIDEVHPRGLILSCWQLTPEERAELAETGRLWLWITGSVQPPVYIGTQRPFTNPEQTAPQG